MAENMAAPVLRSDSNEGNLQKIEAINQSFKEKDIKAKAKKAGIPYIDLKSAPLNQDALQLTSWTNVQQTQAVPFDVGGKTVHLACVDPVSEQCKIASQQLQEKGYQIQPYICSSEGLESTKHYFDNIVPLKQIPIQTEIEEKNMSKQDLFEESRSLFETASGPEMLNRLNLEAIRFRASDLHFQPEEKGVKLRMRRDGEMYEVLTLTPKQYTFISSEIKRVAGLKINQLNLPQDGNYQFLVNKRLVSVRVSALPSKYGESLVLRVLDAQNAIVSLDELGFSDESKKLIIEKIEKEKGLILVTGPTGSGKTSTLYSCLNLINTPDRKIITLEDPIEYELKNIVQSEMNEAEGYTFASGLRAVLRQDPDVIMVGEIRDKEAAEIALQASLTGHLVLTTVHANSAVATIPRLFNMGIKDYILASGLEMILAQRLVRKICDHCKVPAELNDSVRTEIEKAVASLQKKGITLSNATQIFKGAGCDQCAHTTYQGRIAVAEVMNISDEVRKAILSQSSEEEILQKAEEQGFVTMKEDGIRKVLEGKTTIEEIWKVLV
ncbi:MAG: GspE/PulE family protein [Candidatus Altimarinota bacterium]